LATDHFLDALDDAKFALRVRKRQPANLDAAFAVALQMEVWARNNRNQSLDVKPFGKSKKTRKMN